MNNNWKPSFETKQIVSSKVLWKVKRQDKYNNAVKFNTSFFFFVIIDWVFVLWRYPYSFHYNSVNMFVITMIPQINWYEMKFFSCDDRL